MRQIPIVLSLMIVLLMPVYASAQTHDRISVLDNFGIFEKGEPLFIFGEVASLDDDSFLIMQIINPQGDLCQIQQLIPLPNGVFITDTIPLEGESVEFLVSMKLNYFMVIIQNQQHLV